MGLALIAVALLSTPALQPACLGDGDWEPILKLRGPLHGASPCWFELEPSPSAWTPDAASSPSVSVRAPTVLINLRAPSQDRERLRPSDSSAGPAPRSLDASVRVTAACLLGGLFPGLGHVASGTYLYRGLAFSLSFVLTAFAGSTFLMAEEDRLGGPHVATGALVLMVGAQVIYVWSLVDALTLAARDR